MAVKSAVSLNNFFIFNSTLGPREGEEHKKILYFYPDNVDVDKKIKQVGLCEAVIQFTRNFTDKPCESLRTLQTHQVFFEPEPNYWVVMTVNIPCTIKTNKNGKPAKDYSEGDVQDPVFKAVLAQAYEMFRLLNDTFMQIVANGNLQSLIFRLEHFFNKYLHNLHLEQCDIMDIFNGILFLPLHKTTFLLIQSFINLLEDSFPQISYTVFLYNDQLVWSGLEQEDMRVLYCYLTGSLLPGYVASELQGGESSRVAQGHYGKYVVGPPNISDEKMGAGKSMKVYLASSEKGTEFTLVVYRALSATICLLLNGNVDVSIDTYKRLDKFLGPQLSSLASSIAEHYVKAVVSTSSSDVQCKYVYFNCMNLAVKTTVHLDGKRHGGLGVPPDLMRIITDLHQECPAGDTGDEYETFVRAEGDYWVVAKKSDRREFYVIMNQKNANLSEIGDDMKRLCSSQFSNIFFLD